MLKELTQFTIKLLITAAILSATVYGLSKTVTFQTQTRGYLDVENNGSLDANFKDTTRKF